MREEIHAKIVTNMRTAYELMDELDSAADEHSFAEIILARAPGVENRKQPIVICSGEEDRLKQLDKALQGGAVPLGIVVVDLNGRKVDLTFHSFPEHQGKPEMKMLFDDILTQLREQ